MFEIETFGSSSAGNSYLLKDGDSHLLLEAGISPKRMRLDWPKVDGVLVSHEHNDHSAYVADYLKRGVFNAYATNGTIRNFRNVASYRTVEVEYLKQFTIKSWKILPFEVQHDVAEPCGFLILTPSGKKVLFATDTYYVKYKFSGVTHYLIECNYSLDILQHNVANGRIDKGQYKRILTSHFELGDLIKFFEANDLSAAEEIHLIHLSDRNSDEQLFVKEIEKTTGIPTYIAGV